MLLLLTEERSGTERDGTMITGTIITIRSFSLVDKKKKIQLANSLVIILFTVCGNFNQKSRWVTKFYFSLIFSPGYYFSGKWEISKIVKYIKRR